jgi:STE24 endopeptidase
MNSFLIIFSVFYLAEHLLSSWLTRLNLKYAQKRQDEVPARFRETLSLAEYRKIFAYTRDKARLGLLASWVEAPVFWGLLLSGFFGWLDEWLRSLGYGSIVTGLMLFSIVTVLFYVAGLPFNLYSIFTIEQRYGFNRMTWRLWFIDLFKGLLLSALVGIPVLAGILWFMDRYLPGLWWLYVWVFLAVVQLLITSVFPVFIVPLFNKLTPLEEGSLKERILKLARKVKFSHSGIYSMDGSKRSSHSNAFFAGMGRFRRIVLFDTLIKALTEPELLAVVAHEMGHNVKKHIRIGLMIGLGSSLAGLYVLSLLARHPWFYQAFGFALPSSYAALFIFMKIAGPFTFFLTPLFSMLSRKHEYAADRFAAEVLEDAEPMIQGLVKLSKENLSNLTPHPLYSFFYYSHPTVMERIGALEKTVKLPVS